MGIYGFIPVRLSIPPLDLGTSVPLYKLPRGEWFWPLCPGMVAWLKWSMFGWIVVSIRFYVSVLNGFTIPIEYFTDPPISVIGNKIWYGCSIPVIRFIVIIYPNWVAISFVYYSRFLRPVQKSIALLVFGSIVLIAFFNAFICLIFVVRNLMTFLTVFLSLFLFLLWDYTFTINGYVRNDFEMYSALFYICCTFFLLCIITINISLHLSVFGTYFFYLRTVYIHNLFHHIEVHILCCTCAFINWM